MASKNNRVSERQEIQRSDVGTLDVSRQLPAEVAGFVEEQIQFPPYWSPENVGDWFYGMVIDLDDKDPEFVRYVVEAYSPTPCERGDKRNKESVTVEKGEFFTLSAYAALPLDRYIGYRVLVKVKGQRDVGQPQPMWEFTLSISPEDRKVFVEERKQRIAQAMQRYRENRKLGLTPKAAQLPPAPFEQQS